MIGRGQSARDPTRGVVTVPAEREIAVALDRWYRSSDRREATALDEVLNRLRIVDDALISREGLGEPGGVVHLEEGCR